MPETVEADKGYFRSTIFQEHGPWPQMIDFDKNGNVEKLRFPPFHNEILTQNWWNVSENLGRIKVVISEGFFRGSRDPGFERVKNKQIPMPAYYQNASPHRPDEDAHAHSPRGREPKAEKPKDIDISAPIPFSLAPYVANDLEPHCVSPAHASDPFFDSFSYGTQDRQPGPDSFEDQIMLDYTHSATPASSRSVTHQQGNGIPRPISVHGALHDSEYDQLIEALSPLKEPMAGTCAPANTRMSSAQSGMASTKPSAAAEARYASYSKVTARPGTAADYALPAEREVSDVSMRSRFSEDLVEQKENSDLKVYKAPAISVRGKKEGKEVDIENSLSASRYASASSASFEHKISASKRKRSQDMPAKKMYDTDDETPSSPTRKVSKSKKRELADHLGSGYPADANRSPLEPIVNAN
ncbi:hypothetical protein GP486_002356 [Trichoglossum hirsutum]|uniref:Uncharacterized protein n=1 Tax=Trichoglossum hirsutum TaxID=265104 RepID=A0A9P8LF31_9PEZI|nr:hypothetical protein GP486_002356 [Trichoglossum hirsutum]